MAQGGKVYLHEPVIAVQSYEEPINGPYTRTSWETVDLVLFWLSGCAVGLIVALLATGN